MFTVVHKVLVDRDDETLSPNSLIDDGDILPSGYAKIECRKHVVPPAKYMAKVTVALVQEDALPRHVPDY